MYNSVTVRNALGFWRYVLVRVRSPRQRFGLVFFDRGIDAVIDRSADVSVGRHVCFMRDCTLHVFGRLDIGNDVFFNRGCTLVCIEAVSIGQGCRFGEMVSFHDDDYDMTRGPSVASWGRVTAPIVIGDNVWVGAKATILRGVRIGDNSVIGANAVVTRDIPANVMAAGNPARVVREL